MLNYSSGININNSNSKVIQRVSKDGMTFCSEFVCELIQKPGTRYLQIVTEPTLADVLDQYIGDARYVSQIL